MIISVEELKKYIHTEEPDSVLEAKLQALESLVRKDTNNNFQIRGIRANCMILAQKLYCQSIPPLQEGDTVQISESTMNNGVYVIESIRDSYITLSRKLIDEPHALVTLVEYPIDVKMGVVNMMKWDLENRDKVGIQSETISRHSVTYFAMDGDNSSVGYPKSLTGFMNPYRKARF